MLFSQRLRRLIQANSPHLKAARFAHYAPHRLDASRLAATFQPLLSPAQPVESLGIPRRTLSFYQREAGDIPADLAQPMALALVFQGMSFTRDEEEKSCWLVADRQDAPPF